MKFIAMGELGRLSKWLRILGFDVVLEKDKRAVVIKSLREDRVILTRDSKMSRFTGVRMLKIQSDFVREQIEQVMRELGLKINREKLFMTCVICNENLEKVDKDSIKNEVPKYVFENQSSFIRCPKCRKAYWQGTHWALVNKFLDKLKG